MLNSTITLSVEQLDAIKALDKGNYADGVLTRVVLSPVENGAVRVEYHLAIYGDSLVGHRYVLRSGTTLTTVEYMEHADALGL